MIPGASDENGDLGGKPRASGDDPVLYINDKGQIARKPRASGDDPIAPGRGIEPR